MRVDEQLTKYSFNVFQLLLNKRFKAFYFTAKEAIVWIAIISFAVSRIDDELVYMWTGVCHVCMLYTKL